MKFKILILKLSSLGDIVHTLPIVHSLKQIYPECIVDWMTGKKGIELLSLIPGIDNVYLNTFNDIMLARKNNYDFVIDAQGLFKTAILSKIVAGKKNIGFKNSREFSSYFYDEKVDVGNLFSTKKHIVDLNLELISSLNKDKTTKASFEIPKITKPQDINNILCKNMKKNMLVLPATTWESKHWSLDYWFKLLKELQDEFNIIITATKHDIDYLNPLIMKLDSENIQYQNFAGKTNMTDLIYLIQNVDMVMGLDSGGLHLAGAIRHDYGKPDVIGIYGPTSIFRNGLYKMPENCISLLNLECIACRKKICPLGHHKCMNDLVPEFVEGKIKEVLKKSMQSSRA